MITSLTHTSCSETFGSMSQSYLSPDWRPHVDFDVIYDCIERIVSDHATAWRGVAFRFVEPNHALKKNRLEGVGAEKWGGRWNPKGLAAVYGASTRELAMRETYGTADRYGLNEDGLTPRVLFAFEADLGPVIDLTDGYVRQRLRISLETMTTSEWRLSRRRHREAMTQAIGRACCLAGCEAMLVPTRHSTTDNNIVVFPQVSDVADRLRTIQAEKLERGR